MSNQEIFDTVIRLNDSEAKNTLEELRKKVQQLEEAKKKALSAGEDSNFIKTLSKDLTKAKSELKSYETNVSKTVDTINNLSNATAEDIKKTMSALKRVQAGTADPEKYAEMQKLIDQCAARMEEFSSAADKASTNLRSTVTTLQNLDKASEADLRSAQQTLEQQMSTMERGSSAYSRRNEELKQVKQELSNIAAGHRTVNTIVDQYNKEMTEAGREVKKVSTNTELINRTMSKLKTSSLRDLQYTAKALNDELKDVEKGTEKYKQLTEQLKQVKTAMAEINEDTEEGESWWEKAANFFNTNWGVIAEGAAAITGLTVTVRKCVQDFADMEEAEADVRKYTGLTTEQVKELNESLKQMDTRTSRNDLNELAGAAGRLGITAKDEILEFVDAADKIGVALGDDLGDGAVDKIGKLAMAFGEDDKMGLRGAMLATGSAINEVAQNSSANAGYLVEFTARVAGAAQQLGMSQADIMGVGAVLDENMQKDEMSATAFSQLLTKMASDTKTFAGLAGMEVSKFTKLVKEDFNSALLALLESVRKTGDFEKMVNMFDAMNLDGTRSVSVLSTMANKLDDIRDRQELTNRAYNEGTSVIGEFNAMNTTVQAGLDKAKKAFQEVSIELGEKLMPVAKYGITQMSAVVKLLSTLITFVSNNITALAALAVGWAAYEIAVNKATIATKTMEAVDALVFKSKKSMTIIVGVLTGKISLATVAQHAWNAAVKAHPIGAIVTAITAFSYGVLKLTQYLADNEKEQRRVNQSIQEANQNYETLKQKIEELLPIVQDETKSNTERNDALNDLKELCPEYFNNLDIESAKNKSVTQVLHEQNLERLKTLKLIAQQANQEYEEYKRNQDNSVQHSMDFFGNMSTSAGSAMNKTVNNTKNSDYFQSGRLEDLRKSAEEANAAVKELEEALTTLPEVEITGSAGSTGSTGTPTIPGKDNKTTTPEQKMQKELKAEKEKYESMLGYETARYYKGETTYQEYMAKRDEITRQELEAEKEIYEKYGKETGKIDEELAKLTFDERERQTKESLKSLEQDYKQTVNEIYMDYYRTGVDDEKLLHEQLYRAEISYLEKKKNLYRENSEERAQVELEITQKELDEKLEKQKSYQELLKNMQEKYGSDDSVGSQADADYEEALSNLNTLREQNLVDEEEYQTMLDKINDEHEENRREENQKTWEQYLYWAKWAMEKIEPLLSSMSSYYSAQSSYEQAVVEDKYDKLIEAAGDNTAKTEKLEEKKQKELAKIKTKYNNKQMKIELAQATASMVLSAMSAYASVMHDVAYPLNMVLAPIAAGIATAAGLLNIAAIKKQHQAEQLGYYSGGYTGGINYRREAGVVHEGEFVANHQAVNNSQLRPALDLIDHAQRNNTIGQLSAEDVSRALGVGSAQVVAPVVNVSTQSAELTATMSEARATINELNQILAKGLTAYTYIDGDNGVYKQLKRFERMKANK